MKKFLLVIFCLMLAGNVLAAERVVNLTIAYKTVYFAGKARKAMAINNQIPAPALHFKEGDHVTINVRNQLDEETALHWHGLLVPWQMDGVLGISQHGIQPGHVFQYRFTLRQSGTYWYHAHAGLQEQQGLYGALIIDPPKSASYRYTKDYAIVLSDWSNTAPDNIYFNLKKDGDYYSPRFPLQASLAQFIYDYRKGSPQERKALIGDYKTMQQMRMSLYDISDVAYDAFLLNGGTKKAPWTGLVKVGDVVRLRFIGAGASTIFHVKISDALLRVVQVDGNDVKPFTLTDLRIAPGETYDVLVNINRPRPYIIYAESMDTVGAAYGALITSPTQFINFQAVTPFPEPYPVTREMMRNMMSTGMNDNSMSGMKMDHDMSAMNAHDMAGMKMDHDMPGMHMAPKTTAMNGQMDMRMPTEATILGDSISAPALSANAKTTPGTKYQPLNAAVPTNDPAKPIKGVIKMELFGYMDRYIWFINGVPEYNAKPIVLDPGQRYRIIFTNTSMMHHPMHIHGHWFILRKGLGKYDPLLHTIDVAPGATMVADVDTDASGQWFFHCHLLYHMVAGMSRVIQYSSLIDITKGKEKPEDIAYQTNYKNRPIVRVDEVRPIDVHTVKHPMAHPVNLYLASFLELGEDPFHNVQEMNFKGLYGYDYNKLELQTKDAEINKSEVENADVDIFYWRLVSQFWAVKGGLNYFYRPALKPYWQPGIGIEGLMPYFIDTDARSYYHAGSWKLDVELSRDTQFTQNLFLRLGVRGIAATKSVTQAQLGSGLNQMRYTVRPYYRIAPGMNVFIEYELQENYGAFRKMQTNIGDSATENTLTLGLGIVF